MNYYKRHLGDLAKSCADLSQGEMGAYDLLMDWHYANEKPIPNVSERFYRIARATTKAERANVDSVLRDLFDLTADGYVQKRALEEIEKANEQAETNRRIAVEREAKRRARIEREACNEPCSNRDTKEALSHYSITPLAKEQKQKQGRVAAPELPKWLPADVWADWHAFRNARKGWTAKARELSLRTLTELHDQGHDPRRVVDQSIERGWTGLFPIKPDTQPRGSPSVAQQFAGKTYEGTPDDELPDYLRPH